MTATQPAGRCGEARPAALRFVVHGVPAPQGSKNLSAHGHMYESSTRLPAWRAAVTAAVLDTLRRRPHAPIYTGPVRCTITFTIARPLSHHRTGKYAGQLFDDSPLYPVDPPDVDKLARATLDPLTLANVWFDDAGVVELHATKHYQLGQGTQPLHPDILAKPGAVIRIAPLVIP